MAAFEKEEKQKQGSNILAKYSQFQINDVPKTRNHLQNYPKLYQMYVEHQDYENKEAENEDNMDSSVKALSQNETRI